MAEKIKLELTVSFSNGKYPGDVIEVSEKEAKRYVIKGYGKIVEDKPDSKPNTDGDNSKPENKATETTSKTTSKTTNTATGNTDQKQTFGEFCPLHIVKSKSDEFKAFATEKNIDLGEAKSRKDMMAVIKKHWQENTNHGATEDTEKKVDSESSEVDNSIES